MVGLIFGPTVCFCIFYKKGLTYPQNHDILTLAVGILEKYSRGRRGAPAKGIGR